MAESDQTGWDSSNPVGTETIGNTPVQSPLLLKLAQILKASGQDSPDLAKMAPALNYLKKGAANVMGLPAAGDELENQAYGNMPLQNRQDGDKIPFFKPGRQDSAAALAGVTPVGAAGKAMLLPVKIARDLKVPDEVMTSAMNASKSLNETPGLGQGLQSQLWNDHGVVEVPRGRFGSPRSDTDGRFMYEVPDTDAKLNPAVLQSRTDKLRGFLKENPSWDASYNDPDKSAFFSKDNGAGAKNRAVLTDAVRQTALKPGSYQLGDLLDHPELYKQVPGLRTTAVNVDPSLAPGNGVKRWSDGGSQIIDVATRGGNTDPRDILLHETQHVLQDKFDMPRGSNPTSSTIPDVYRNRLQSVLSNPSADPAVKKTIGRVMGQTPHETYQDVLGEQQSSATEARSDLSRPQLAARTPLADYRNPTSGPTFGTINGLKQLAKLQTTGGTTPISASDVAALAEMLRKTQ